VRSPGIVSLRCLRARRDLLVIARGCQSQSLLRFCAVLSSPMPVRPLTFLTVLSKKLSQTETGAQSHSWWRPVSIDLTRRRAKPPSWCRPRAEFVGRTRCSGGSGMLGLNPKCGRDARCTDVVAWGRYARTVAAGHRGRGGRVVRLRLHWRTDYWGTQPVPAGGRRIGLSQEPGEKGRARPRKTAA
jgi:hypothetical protein